MQYSTNPVDEEKLPVVAEDWFVCPNFYCKDEFEIAWEVGDGVRKIVLCPKCRTACVVAVVLIHANPVRSGIVVTGV